MLTFLRFQSAHPVWGAIGPLRDYSQFDSYFNPRTPYGVRPLVQKWHCLPTNISIHAPRMGCDVEKVCAKFDNFFISIHAPRMGCDIPTSFVLPATPLFQSTHPVWGATFYDKNNRDKSKFQSTHPVWGATFEDKNNSVSQGISIHAPRMGCDKSSRHRNNPHHHFNPRTPYGVRHTR